MTTRHTISGADKLYAGDVRHPGYEPDARRGVELGHFIFKDYGVIEAVDDDKIIDAATSTELPDTETVTYTPATDGTSPLDNGDGRFSTTTLKGLDGTSTLVYDLVTPRNIVSKMTHDSSVVASTILYSGFDEYMEPMSELHTVTATGTAKTVTGTKAFRYLASAAISSLADSEANTLNVGVGNVIGLPVKITTKNAVLARVDGVDDAATRVVGVTTDPATTTTGDVRGTVDFDTDPTGTSDHGVWIWVEAHDTKENTFGVTQA